MIIFQTKLFLSSYGIQFLEIAEFICQTSMLRVENVAYLLNEIFRNIPFLLSSTLNDLI
jgi:hypothetical protein